MRFLRTGAVLASALLVFTAAQAEKPHHKSASHSSSRSHGKAAPRKAKFNHPAAMSQDRATAIQAALIKQNYMAGEPNGIWDSASQAAMTKYQADHGWQTKVTPDSRALISLGLGPDQTGAAPVAASATTQRSVPATSSYSASTRQTTPSQKGSLGSAIAAQQNFLSE